MQGTFPPHLSLDLESLSTNSDFLSQNITPIISTPLRPLSSLTPTTPRLPMASAHIRRKTYAGDLAVATRGIIHEYEERIALLEAQNSRISVELNATQDALVDEREDRRIERQSLTIPETSSFPAQTGPDRHISERSELLYERKLRMEILDTLKKIRAQNTTLSQSLRAAEENYNSLDSVLKAEHIEKEELRDEIKELSQRNFTLYQHNKLLVNRDTVLQEEISSLMTKSQADDWMRGVLEEELRKQRSKQSSPDDNSHDISTSPHVRQISVPAITLEHQGPLRAQLVAAQDKQFIAQRCLEVSEKQCEELENRISSLQRNITQCLDSSAQALELERELRAEVEEYSRSLAEENSRLQDKIQDLQKAERQNDTAVPEINPALNDVSDVLKDTTKRQESLMHAAMLFEPHIPHHDLCGNVQNISVDVRNVTLSPVVDGRLDGSEAGDENGLKARHRELIFNQQFCVSSKKKTLQRRATAVFSRSALYSPAPTVTGDLPGMSSSVMGDTSPLALPRRIVTPVNSDYNIRTAPTRYSRPPLSSTSNPLAAEAHIPTKRDSVVLKPLQLVSSVEVTSKRLTLHAPSRPMSVVEPSPIFPPAPPSTPKEDQTTQNKLNYWFRNGSTASADYPCTPDSSSSTLVASSPASANVDKGKSSLIATTLLKKPSLDPKLKATTTLFLDMRGEREKYQLTDSIATSITHIQVPPSSIHMRRASKVLASIAKRTGIGGLEDWFVV
ncbi:hypothetical protein C8J55DRAFT_608523 [Lentinula edodes]|uniref:Uncharacterized protein n=1 Tax=Lentinula lateritia TaxID=40482 RepID=A0A9W8ZX80_9AGAR|nr:hypothetical protein C8J55DRAFT_608523 [Lentinula edodes]